MHTCVQTINCSMRCQRYVIIAFKQYNCKKNPKTDYTRCLYVILSLKLNIYVQSLPLLIDMLLFVSGITNADLSTAARMQCTNPIMFFVFNNIYYFLFYRVVIYIHLKSS